MSWEVDTGIGEIAVSPQPGSEFAYWHYLKLLAGRDLEDLSSGNRRRLSADDASQVWRWPMLLQGESIPEKAGHQISQLLDFQLVRKF